MSYRELTSTEVREIIRRWQAGQSARRMKRDGVADRKTVARYVSAAVRCGVREHSELSDEVVATVARQIQSRRKPRGPSAQRVQLEANRARIEQWLQAGEGVGLLQVHQLLEREGVKVGYTTLRRYARSALGWRERDGAGQRVP